MMKMIFYVVICLLIHKSNCNPDFDETMLAFLKRLQKLEEVVQEQQLQISTLQEMVLKGEEENKKQQDRILKLENVLNWSQWEETNVASTIQKRLVINDGNTTPVAFSATLKNEIVDVPNQHLIKMTSVILNEGNGYNANDGIFFCPKSGLYLFHWSAMPPLQKSLYLNLMVNGVSYARIHSNSNPSYQTSSNLAIVRLNAGDHVFLESASTTSSFHAYYCSFSGVRLSN